MKVYTKITAISAAVLLLLVPSAVGAAEFIRPTEEDKSVVLGTTETHKNLYAAGANVTVNSSTQGDLVVAGGTITVDGNVDGDVLVAGGTVVVNSKIGGDIRVAGGTVTINGEVGGDVVSASGSAVVSERARIGGDLISASGSMTLNAPVSGKVWAAGGTVTLNSKVDGPVAVRNAELLTFGSKAEIAGAITVRGKNQPMVKDGAKLSQVDYQRLHGSFSKSAAARAALIGILIWILANMFVALVLSWVAPRRIEGFAAQVKKRFWTNVLIGLAGVLVTAVIVFVLFIVAVGYHLALLLLTGLMFALILSWILAILWTGSWVYQLVTKRPTMLVNWQIAIIGAVVFTLIRFIPVVGVTFCTIICLANLGQFLVNTKQAVVEKQVDIE